MSHFGDKQKIYTYDFIMCFLFCNLHSSWVINIFYIKKNLHYHF